MARVLQLYNTATRAKEPVHPTGPVLGMYCCGPTVYNFAHVGNLRSYINEDVLRRALEVFGLPVRHVMNITDVGHLTSDADEGEDKMAKGARREGKTVWEIARYYENKFFEDIDALHVLRAHVVCRATEHIPEMIELVRRIEANGYAYMAEGNVYFDIERFPRYTDLARLSMDQLRAGARVDVDGSKRNPMDFVLWFTRSKHGEQDMQWDSPWGRGFPGWALECSAMSMKYLGEQFDIHCGGIDHVPIHHTNEIAQTEAATGKHPWVRYWVHNEFLVMNKGKMAKSGESFVTLEAVRQKGIDPLAYRMFCFTGHYRSQLAFTWESVQGAVASLRNLRALVPPAGPEAVDKALVVAAVEPFLDALADDLNMPQAIAAVWDMLRDQSVAPQVRRAAAQECDRVLALDLVAGADAAAQSRQFDVDGVVVRFVGTGVEHVATSEFAATVAKRAAARKARDFAAADRLRDEIAKMGVVVKDMQDGSAEVRVAG